MSAIESPATANTSTGGGGKNGCPAPHASAPEWSGLFSVRVLLLALPLLAMSIQTGLFLVGRTCSPFPMWIAFAACSLLALAAHWKRMVRFWGLVLLALLLGAYTFAYCGIDTDICHIPMQLLLREGWNPVFDSTLEKFGTVVDIPLVSVYHTLFMPKTAAFCGALAAQATGLWECSAFLGYLLLFAMSRTAFVFAGRLWGCGRWGGLLFAVSVSVTSTMTRMLEGPNDFHWYAALVTALLSLVLYHRDRNPRDCLLAVMASAICATVKSAGLANVVLLWGAFWLCSRKRGEPCRGLPAVTLLVLWIGISPLVTSWIQYGSPLYPAATFDPKIEPADVTDDFRANADGERMGHLARFVHGWISPALAKKACALWYRKADFDPVFFVRNGVGGLKSLNVLFCLGIVLLLLARKNPVTLAGLWIVLTLICYPVKYIGFLRYFPHAWLVVPLGIYQFCRFPPGWLRRWPPAERALRISLYSVLGAVSLAYCLNVFAFQWRCMTIEGRMQELLASYRETGTTVEIPCNAQRGYAVSKRLACGNVDHVVGRRKMENFDEDTSFPRYKEYFLTYWRYLGEYPVCNTPANLLRFKWLDLFRHFPHPLFYRPSPDRDPLPEAGNPPGNSR